MANAVKVKFNFKIDKKLIAKNIMGPTTSRKIGTSVVRDLKKFISKGRSPIKRGSRFVAYASQRIKEKRNKRKRYPLSVQDEFPDKRVRPVNLKLSGEFLKNLTWWRTRLGGLLKIGMSKSTGRRSRPSKKILAMFKTHNEGTHKDVPQRKFLPTNRGEQLAVTIERNIKKISEKRINDIIRKENKGRSRR